VRFRHICEVEEASGKKPVSKWLWKNMDRRELARLHVRFGRIETDQVLPEEWLKPYVSLKLTELKLDIRNRAIRILCWERGTEVILLAPDAKKGQIDGTVEAQAVERRTAIQEGRANVRSYPLPGRPSDDLESVGR
jgi:hypothetical protein